MFQGKTSDAAAVSAPAAALNTSFQGNATSSGANCSIINEWLVMRGDLESAGDILVKGRVIGNINCKLLIVDADAIIEGGIDAEEAVIRGTTKGVIRAHRVRVERTADVEGQIFQDSFAAEEGARIRGALKSLDDAASASHVPSAEIVDLAHAGEDNADIKPGGAFYQRLGAARAAHAPSK